MKKFQRILAVLSLTLMLFSCGGGNSPQSVAEDFIVAFSNKDFKKAKELSTDATKRIITLFAEMIEEMPKEQQNIEILDGLNKIKWGKTIIKDGKATVYYEEEKGKKEKIYLTKVNGVWKINMRKEH